VKTLGLTAGASAPEVLVEEIVAACRARFDVTVETVRTAQENVSFKIPRALRDAAAE
jgi:4-hydroxy-3-methylbut-2-enyl diphosphate reductase